MFRIQFMDTIESSLPAKNSTSIVLPTLATFFVLTLFSAQFLSYKMVSVDKFVMSAATFVVPLWYLLGDAITELYGYRITRKLIWVTMITTIIFSILLQSLIHLPSPTGWKYQPDFDYVLGHLLRIALADFVGIFLGGFINSIALSKWKILFKGKYYWSRSLASSIVGQAVYILIALPYIFYGMVSTKVLLEIMLASLIAKSLIVILAIGPISLLVKVLKVVEKTDPYDYHINYNPFKFT